MSFSRNSDPTDYHSPAGIRENDVVEVLYNAVNYGKPWSPLYMAAIDEIIELRKQVLALGGTLPLNTNLFTGITKQQRTEHYANESLWRHGNKEI